MLEDTIRLMYDTALIASGYTQEDPVVYTKRVFNIIQACLTVPEPDPVEPPTEDDQNDMESLD